MLIINIEGNTFILKEKSSISHYIALVPRWPALPESSDRETSGMMQSKISGYTDTIL